MKFSEMITQTLAWLQREGRVSYRALRLEFDLSDDVLDALKEEIIEIKEAAVDKDGKVLVWVGEGINGEKEKGISGKAEGETGKRGNGETGGVPRQWTPAHLAERIRAEQAALEARSGTDGERKTITALFADLKGSTALIEGLDPEEARAILDPALQVMMDAVHQYDGFVAQALGDGIFALFGAPLAHEDHPQRALYAALRMQEEMWGYSAQVRRPEYRHEWGQKTYYTQLRLAPLGQAEAEELLDTLLGTRVETLHATSLRALKQLILNKTQGTPFFMEEVVQELFEQGLLVRDTTGDQHAVSLPTDLHIPTTVQGVLAARIDRLVPDEKSLLQQLAVIGRGFPVSLVKQVITQPEDELYRLLGSLQRKEFLYEQPAFPEPEYFFKHALTQEGLRPQAEGLREKTEEAERCFLRVIDIARRQQAKSLELRAVMSLVRLRQQQAALSESRSTDHVLRAKLDEARRMLSDVYHWFTEGFDTKDLQEAKGLVEELKY